MTNKLNALITAAGMGDDTSETHQKLYREVLTDVLATKFTHVPTEVLMHWATTTGREIDDWERARDRSRSQFETAVTQIARETRQLEALKSELWLRENSEEPEEEEPDE